MDGASPDRVPTLAASQRIGDAEREGAGAALSEHFAAGRLDHSEFDVRLHAAYAAQTATELAPLFADLPAPGPRFVRATAAVPKRPAMSGRHWHGPSIFHLLVPLLVVVVFVSLFTDDQRGPSPFFLIGAFYFMGGFRWLGRMGRRRVW
jgi:Domain of unknown function (DUF1707)